MKLSPKILPTSDKLNPTQRKSIGAGKYEGPRERHPNEALPRDFLESQLPSAVIPKMEPVRPGANDFLKIRRVGVNC